MKEIKFKVPMRCADVVDTSLLNYPLIATTKYDGVYALVKDGQLLGRSLKPIKNKQIAEILSQPEFEGFVGELCYGSKLNIQELCRTTTSHVSSHDKEWEDGFTWMLFDYAHEDVIHLPYIERLDVLKERLYEALGELSNTKQYNHLNNIQVAPQVVCTSSSDVDELYNNNVDNGYEGIILRSPNGEWKNGRNSPKQDLFLRMKPSSDSEFVITGVVEALQNNNVATTNELGYTERSSHQENKVGKGMIGAFTGIDVESGILITVGAGKLTHSERVEAFENPPIGSVAKYRSMTSGVKDLPRFPRFISYRDITDLDEVTLSKVEAIIKRIGVML